MQPHSVTPVHLHSNESGQSLDAQMCNRHQKQYFDFVDKKIIILTLHITDIQINEKISL